MPVLNGLGFLETYKQLSFSLPHPVIIIMLTTSLHPKDLERARQLPIADFLQKPLTSENVRALLDRFFPTSTLP